MKCYCHQEIKLSKQQPPNENITRWHCPEEHVYLLRYRARGPDIVAYSLVWDDDHKTRYRVDWDSVGNETRLSQGHHKDLSIGQEGYYGYHYTNILVLPGQVALPFNEQQEIQADKLVPRLLRLKAFW